MPKRESSPMNGCSLFCLSNKSDATAAQHGGSNYFVLVF